MSAVNADAIRKNTRSRHVLEKAGFRFRNVTDKEYMAGIHADVDKNTDMKVFIYDGKDTEPYTK